MKKIELPNGTITSAIDIPDDIINGIIEKAIRNNGKATLEDFNGKLEVYNLYLSTMKSINKFHENLKNTVLLAEDESKEITEKYYSLQEWRKAAKRHKLTITVSGMAGAQHKSAKIYYANGEHGGGYFYLYSPNNGEGSLTIINK